MNKKFIDFCLAHKIIQFGDFTLKSGRKSPYFFNAGLFNTGETIATLGKFYAQAIIEAKIDFDVLFGPAYKGIPLAVSTAIALSAHNINKPFCFNRKISKDHGEGGNLVGAPLQGKVLIIDDVITAGTAIRESLALIQENNATLAGIAVAFDRQEKGQHSLSAITEIEQTHQTQVISIIKFTDLVSYVENTSTFSQYLGMIEEYRQQYGVTQHDQ